MVLTLSILIAGIGFDPVPWFLIAGKRASQGLTYGWTMIGRFDISRENGEYLLAQNISGLPGRFPGVSWKEVFSYTGIVIDEPYIMMASYLQPLALHASALAMIEPEELSEERGADDTPPREDETTSLQQYPALAIYCTHNAETYIPNDNQSHVKGERGLINQVAENLTQSLNNQGFRAIFCDTIHDSPDYSLSYVRSRETVLRLVQEEEWAVLIDVHRDSIPGKKTPQVVEIEGKKAAQILLVIGSDQRKPNPNWRKNLTFAENIRELGQKRYPGLIREVRVRPGTYNQEIHYPSILIEVGNEYNSLEEACLGVELFADLLGQVLMEGEQNEI